MQNMQNTLKTKVEKFNCKFLQFSIQNDIYQISNFSNFVKTIINSIVQIVDKNHFIVQTNSNIQKIVIIFIMRFVEKIVIIFMINYHVESTSKIILQIFNQNSMIVDEQHKKILNTKKKQNLKKNSNFVQKRIST